MSPEYYSKQIMPLMNVLCSDPIVNVRITVCQVLKTMYMRNGGEKEGVKKWLRALGDDKEKDVKETAQKIMKEI